MTVYTYKTIVQKANSIKNNTEKNYKLGETRLWSFYIASAIVKPNTNFTKKTITNVTKANLGKYISRQIKKNDYIGLCKKLIAYCNNNGRLPPYVKYGSYEINIDVFTYMIAKILVYYNTHKQLPNYVDITSKCFTKPHEPADEVYEFFAKTFGFKPKTMDEILEYVANHFSYEYYYDDKKSNKEVIKTKAGNCTDLLQMLINLLIKLGYKWEVLHVLCSGGDGHVRGRFKHSKYTEGEWVYRDIACVASNGSIRCNWCIEDYTLLARNPSWFLENLNR